MPDMFSPLSHHQGYVASGGCGLKAGSVGEPTSNNYPPFASSHVFYRYRDPSGILEALTNTAADPKPSVKRPVIMNGFSPIHSYVFGTVSVGLGLHALLRPRQEYPRFGLPLEPSGPSPTNTSPISKGTTGSSSSSSSNNNIFSRIRSQASLAGEDGSASPLVYLKSTRELSYGLALIGLQYQGNSAGVTTVVGVMSLAALGDGLMVWFHGGKRFRANAWGHLGAAVGLGSWAVWRAFVAYGEWAGFHALN